MNHQNAIDALNTLVEINNDRIEGYKTAAEETDEMSLQTLFAQFSKTSQKCHAELVTEVRSLGGTPAEGTKTSGKIYRVWMDFKALLTGKSRSTILNSCEYGEDVALATYDDVLSDNLEDLTSVQQAMLRVQRLLIKADHDKVKALRDMATA